MKIILAASLIASLLANACFAAPQFDGVIASKGETYFAVREEQTAPTKWIKLGDHFGPYAIKSYDGTKETLSLIADGVATEVALRTGSARPGQTQSGKSSRIGPALFRPTFELLEKLVSGGDLTRQDELQLLGSMEQRRNETAAKLAVLERAASGDARKLADLSEWRRRLQLEDENLEHCTEQMLQAWRTQISTGK